MSLSSPPSLDAPLPRIAVLGCGYWGRNLVRNFAQLGALAAVVDPSPAGREEARTLAPTAEIFADPEALWSREDLAGVVIATPAPTHAELASQAMDAGLDVLVEKPMALDAAEAEHLVAKAEALGRLLMVGHLLEHHPAVRALYQLVAEQALGPLRFLECRRLNFGKIRSAENVLWSLSPHDLSVMLRIAGGPPKAVTCTGRAYVQDGVADVVHARLEFASGLEGNLQASWLNPFKEQRLVVVGERGALVFDDTQAAGKLQRYAHRIDWTAQGPQARPAKPEIVPYGETEPLRAECQHFLECLRTRQTPFTDGQSALGVMRTLEACQRSLERGERVELAEEAAFTR